MPAAPTKFCSIAKHPLSQPAPKAFADLYVRPVAADSSDSNVDDFCCRCYEYLLQSA